MNSAAELVRQSRLGAGLSVRALAQRAGVPASTVTRVEHGHVDPTWSTLVRLLTAAGVDVTVSRALSPLRSLADAWNDERGSPDWTRLRAWLSAASSAPRAAVSAAIASPLPRSTPPVMANLLAGIAEHLAHEAGQPAPAWTAKIIRLPQPWSAPATSRMAQAWRTTTPRTLADRNLIVDTATLWRP